MSPNYENIIILTATVTPPKGAAQLARMDRDLRLNDYRKALELYLSLIRSNVISKIVFADNSNSNIESLKELVASNGFALNVEFLSFDGLDHPPEYGRGYGEFKLLDYVMTHSITINNASPNDKIWKITGRYIVKNIVELIQSAPGEIDIYCNYRNIPKYWIDLYIICWNKAAYTDILLSIYKHMREDINAKSSEILFREELDAKFSRWKIIKRFKRTPLISGKRGVDNKDYEDMFVKNWLRIVLVRIAPWLWI